MSSEVALPRAENIYSSFRDSRQYTLYRLSLTISHIIMKDKSFIFNQLYLDLDFKSIRKQPFEPEDRGYSLMLCCCYHSAAPSAGRADCGCDKVLSSSVLFTRCRSLADAQWTWTTDVPLQSWSALAPNSDHFILWCLQSGCPVVSS